VHAPHHGAIHLDDQNGDWDGHCVLCRHSLTVGATARPTAGPLPVLSPLRQPAARLWLSASPPAPAYAPLSARPPPA
jgi:hypothetical protein